MWLEVMGKGSLVLDWGKGEKEVLEFDVDPENMTATGYFAREQCYALWIPAARITGDVHLLTGIFFESDVDALNTDHATNLHSLALTYTDLSTLKLDLNSELTALNFTESQIGQIIFPQQHGIRELVFRRAEWSTWPTVADLDYIIDNIHMNAVAENIRDGYVILDGSPVSAETASKLMGLQNSYGWSIDEIIVQ
jgi:hypothetical protein